MQEWVHPLAVYTVWPSLFIPLACMLPVKWLVGVLLLLVGLWALLSPLLALPPTWLGKAE